jgi:hypothetical protein
VRIGHAAQYSPCPRWILMSGFVKRLNLVSGEPGPTRATGALPRVKSRHNHILAGKAVIIVARLNSPGDFFVQAAIEDAIMICALFTFVNRGG